MTQEADSEHIPWSYTEYGALCACGAAMINERCPVLDAGAGTTTPGVSAEWRTHLRTLADAATPGPWEQDGLRIADADAAFIVAAREAVPALLIECDRLDDAIDELAVLRAKLAEVQAERDRLRGTLKRIRGLSLSWKRSWGTWAAHEVTKEVDAALTQEVRDE